MFSYRFRLNVLENSTSIYVRLFLSFFSKVTMLSNELKAHLFILREYEAKKKIVADEKLYLIL
jgi:hypothetical protein